MPHMVRNINLIFAAGTRLRIDAAEVRSLHLLGVHTDISIDTEAELNLVQRCQAYDIEVVKALDHNITDIETNETLPVRIGEYLATNQIIAIEIICIQPGMRLTIALPYNEENTMQEVAADEKVYSLRSINEC